MSFGNYFKVHLWDMILCIILGYGLATTIFRGFYISDAILNNYLQTILVIGILNIYFFSVAYSRKTILIGIIVFIMLAGGALLAIRETQNRNIFSDQENNPYMYFVLLIIITITIFLLSRTRLGTWALAIIGTISICFIQFLYSSNQWLSLYLFLWAWAMMQIYRNYSYNVLHSQTTKVDLVKNTLVSAVLCGFILLLATGVFYGIVKQLHPPAAEVKLITKYMSYEVLDKVGVTNVEGIQNPDKVTKNQDDNKTHDKNPDDTNTNKKENNHNPTWLDHSKTKMFYAIKYIVKISNLFIFIGLILVLIAMAIFIKLWRRKKWLKDVLALEKEEQIKKMYQFYLKKFKIVGVVKAPEETPFEFANRGTEALKAFSRSGTNISSLTEIFVKVQYGDQTVSENEQKCYLDFHQGFYKGCLECLGKFKYGVNFFII